ncbi:unnamed protein product [Durusdinium trenchii]|uniref:Uncharacterized protein n=1 Tax=Durusdinium trenchii TaxID=1381693 RepID=A0ABP0R285_9DINO
MWRKNNGEAPERINVSMFPFGLRFNALCRTPLRRINSSSFDPALAKSKQSLRSRRSSRLQANLDNQFQADVPVVEEELRHQAVGEEQEQSRPRSDEGLKSAWI